jgi:DNA-directed RNA polymerase subunit RPC12/RpoP
MTEYKCPNCGKVVFTGSIGEHSVVVRWCECGTSIDCDSQGVFGYRLPEVKQNE